MFKFFYLARNLSIVKLSFLLLFSSSALATAAIEKMLPMDKVKSLVVLEKLMIDGKKIKLTDGIVAGRYMDDNIAKRDCEKTTFPNWDGFPLIKCTYEQYDTDLLTKKRIATKTATVIMLNPDKELLAKWITASCLIVSGEKNFEDCADKLAYKIIDASGSQFAVAGIVLEDIHPEDGIQEAYIFRDGVTVCVKDGIGVCNPDGYERFTGMFGEKENAISLDFGKEVLATASNDGPARIQNTTRDEYKNYFGSKAKDVEGTKWLDVVRELYQDAWKRAHNSEIPETIEKYRNDLMVAKCYSLMGIKPRDEAKITSVTIKKADNEIVVPMSVDVDGAPNSYGPDNKTALDLELNAHVDAKKSGAIVGYLLDKHGNPIIQGSNDPAPGFYISTTRYSDVNNHNETDPRRYVNAAEINYTVLANSAKEKGVETGDFCIVHSVKNNKTVFAIVGDTGHSSGAEGSLALIQRLGYPVKDGKSVPHGVDISHIVVRYFAKSNPYKQFFFNQSDLDSAAKALNLDADFTRFHQP